MICGKNISEVRTKILDSKSLELISRDDLSDGFNQYWDYSEAPLVKKYDSEE
jgi:hypothetical protein